MDDSYTLTFGRCDLHIWIAKFYMSYELNPLLYRCNCLANKLLTFMPGPGSIMFAYFTQKTHFAVSEKFGMTLIINSYDKKIILWINGISVSITD